MEKKVEVNGGLIFENKKYSSYETFFNEQYEIYKKILLSYIEDDKNIPLNQYNPAYSFLHIHELVEKQWGRKILNILPEKIRTKQKIDSQKGYTSYKIGFFQMCLAENSGVKISPLNQLEQRISNESRLYIIDPELQYVKKKYR